MDNVTFYGIELENEHCEAVLEFIAFAMSRSFNNKPINYNDGMICMAGDITLHVWGSPAEAHVIVIELSHPEYRTLH